MKCEWWMVDFTCSIVLNLTMKKIVGVILGVGVSAFAFTQTPVHWNYQAHKLNDKEWEVKLTATIDNGWHLYSQQQPEDAIALPTEIVFNKNPLVELKDKVKENGKLEKYKDKTLDIEAWQYAGKVEFVQVVKKKAKVKTTVSGSIEYQVCTDEKCLPPKKIPFTIAIN